MTNDMTQKKTNDERPSWDQTWLAVAEIIAKRSRCSRAQVGAVIVSKDQRIAASGYNSASALWPHSGFCIDWCPRAQGHAPLDNTYDQCPSIHAEANALLYVDRSRVEGGTVYVTCAPCMQCAKLISNSGIRRIVCRVKPEDAHRRPELVFKYLEDLGLDYTIVSDTEDGGVEIDNH